MKPTIEITHTTTPLPAHLSGAALRSAQAADREAEIAVARLRAAAARLESVLHEETTSAAMLAEGCNALVDYAAARGGLGGIVPRHSIRIQEVHQWRPGAFETPAMVLGTRAEVYAKRLRDAGIPMPDGDIYNPQYWHDAAARGC